MTPATMRAVVLRAPGGPEHLRCEMVATPPPRRGEALVRVHAAALTRDELEWPVDRLPAIPSYEVSGHAEAAAVPLPALSAWQGLFDHGRLAAGQRVLIHGATGGVGQFATPLAAQHGAHITATTSTPRRGARTRARRRHRGGPHRRALGRGPRTRRPRLRHRGRRAARPLPGVLREGGRLVSVAEEPPQAPGITSVYFVVEPNREQLARIGRLYDDGWPPPAIDSVFTLEEATSAFERTLAADTRGKVVLEVTELTTRRADADRPPIGRHD